jgi:hypothetical protein
MKPPDKCHEFQNWLERLPRKELSPRFTRHMEQCSRCRTDYENLNPVAEALIVNQADIVFSQSQIQAMAQCIRQVSDRQGVRRLAFRLGAVSLISVPVIVLINWFWALSGFHFLSLYVSPLVAQIYLGVFVAAETGLAGLIYSAIPLLAGWLNRSSRLEIAVMEKGV